MRLPNRRQRSSEPAKRRNWNGWRVLDERFPTVVRYVGIVLMIYAGVIDMGRDPALIPAATGLIFFKTIYGYRSDGNGNGSRNGRTDSASRDGNRDGAAEQARTPK
jgi:hypothetical protein